jgi:hypothetical protein
MNRVAVRKQWAFVLAISMWAGACSSLAYRSRVEEFHNSSLSASRYGVVAVLPVDPKGFDTNIAARVRDHLKKEGWKVVPALKLVGEGEVTTKEVCEPTQHPEYTGVVFVSWDRLILRDCETTAVAYRATGGYAGIDKLTQRFMVYLKAAPAAAPQP